MNKPLINNLRAEREWLYLCGKVGEKKALDGIRNLAGNRQPFPMNIAKVLNVTLPDESYLPFTAEQKKKSSEAARRAWKAMHIDL